jgi:uncharacterized protein (DUF1501 family)
VTLDGWDTHAKAFQDIKARCDILDSAWATLLTDLQKRRLLDRTLVVWMGEFGRTPRINPSKGRDHYPLAFTVVLAGGGIKGGQVIGATSIDGSQVVQRPVTPPELLATILQALQIDPTRENDTGLGGRVSLVPRGTQAVQEVLK